MKYNHKITNQKNFICRRFIYIYIWQPNLKSKWSFIVSVKIVYELLKNYFDNWFQHMTNTNYERNDIPSHS